MCMSFARQVEVLFCIDRRRLGHIKLNTEHHQGKESRIIPLFPEIRPYLEEQYELAEPGNPFVIVTKRSKNSNLRRRFKKIVGRAGLQPWPKLFQNRHHLPHQFPL